MLETVDSVCQNAANLEFAANNKGKINGRTHPIGKAET